MKEKMGFVKFGSESGEQESGLIHVWYLVRDRQEVLAWSFLEKPSFLEQGKQIKTESGKKINWDAGWREITAEDWIQPFVAGLNRDKIRETKDKFLVGFMPVLTLFVFDVVVASCEMKVFTLDNDALRFSTSWKEATVKKDLEEIHELKLSKQVRIATYREALQEGITQYWTFREWVNRKGYYVEIMKAYTEVERMERGTFWKLERDPRVHALGIQPISVHFESIKPMSEVGKEEPQKKEGTGDPIQDALNEVFRKK